MLFLFHGLTSFFSFRLGPAFLLYPILRIENDRKMIGRLQVGNVEKKVLFLFEQGEGELGIPLELNLRYAPYLLRFEDWESDGKNAPLVKETCNGDVPAVDSGDSPCQTESQTNAKGRSTLVTSV